MDEAVSVWLYTSDCCPPVFLHGLLNADLLLRKKERLMMWRLYIFLLLRGLAKLPQVIQPWILCHR